MNIISWNVNGIRAVEKKGFIDWITQSDADVICIQETKANPSQLSPELLAPPTKDGGSYVSFFSSAKKAGYSGTAIYSKTQPDSFEILGDSAFDDEGRVCIAKFKKLAVISAYFPNSQDAGARLPYKLDFCEAILKKCNQLVSEGFGITTRNFWRVVNLILNSNLFVHIEQTSLKLYNYLHDNN